MSSKKILKVENSAKLKMSPFSRNDLVMKLQMLKSSQQCIETLSHWIIHYRAHFECIVDTWAHEFIKVSDKMQVNFMYLASDVIQISLQKGSEFRTKFATVLPTIFSLFGINNPSEWIEQQLTIILNVWNERKIYDTKIIDDFGARLQNENESLSTASLIQMMDKLEDSAPSKNLEIRQFIANISPKVGDVIGLDSSQDIMKEFTEEVNEALEVVDDYNAKLKDEMKDRDKLYFMLHEYLAEQELLMVKAERYAKKNLKEIATIKKVESEIKEHLRNLPDIPKIIEPLPSIHDLFK